MESSRDGQNESALFDGEGGEQQHVDVLTLRELLRSEDEGLVPHMEYLINMINNVQVSAMFSTKLEANCDRLRKVRT
jgi:hypothetical protein